MSIFKFSSSEMNHSCLDATESYFFSQSSTIIKCGDSWFILKIKIVNINVRSDFNSLKNETTSKNDYSISNSLDRKRNIESWDFRQLLC